MWEEKLVKQLLAKGTRIVKTKPKVEIQEKKIMHKVEANVAFFPKKGNEK